MPDVFDFGFLLEPAEWAFTVHAFVNGATQRHEVHSLVAAITAQMARILRDAGSLFRTGITVPNTGDVKLRISQTPFRTVIPLTLGANSVKIKGLSQRETVVMLDDGGGVMRLVGAFAKEVARYAQRLAKRPLHGAKA